MIKRNPEDIDDDVTEETIVLPLFEIVVFPKTRTKIQVDDRTGTILGMALEKAERAYALGMTVRPEKAGPAEVSGDMVYPTGNLLRIASVQPADTGYLVYAEAVARVAAETFVQKDGLLYASFRLVPDQPDLDDAVQADLIIAIKKTIHEISNRFQSSEHFTKPLDNMDSIDQIMGFIVPFMPVPLAEKQELMEITSVNERYNAFLDRKSVV